MSFPLRCVGRPLLPLSALLVGLWGSTARAQKPVTVTGVAYDSLRGAPLANAFVILTERGKSTSSDDKGRFRFDSVPPGTYTFAMQHAVFDSLGLSGATTKATVTDGKAPVVLAVPSFATLWRAACGTPAPTGRDTGFVYGTVRDAATRKSVPQAWVALSWTDLVKLDPAKKSTNVTQRRYNNEVQGDKQGGYAICNVPTGLPLVVRAFNGANTTPSVTMSATSDRVRRLDLVLSGTTVADAQRKGTVRGVVSDSGGRGIRDIRVSIGELETRSDPDGGFTLRGVPTGTRQIDAAAVGFNPTSTAVDVFADDTARVQLTTFRLNALDTLKIRAVSAKGRVRIMEFEARRVRGFGSYLDSVAIGKRATVSAALQAVPGLTVENMTANGRRFNLYLPSTSTGQCMATLVLDGVQQNDTEVFNTLSPSDLAAIEVYQQRTTVPSEFQRVQQNCGAVVVWTKRAFR
ncbi:MAG: carboxypeptidase regulatory-like domain-containing protein [Gemmatimonadaceae bacterium]|nr:carboxypeptidase regulatory-like domain-containing protein [Gemmatimonadaceae bacterium]